MSHAAWTHNTQTVFNKGAQLAYYERRAAGTVDRQRDEDPLEWTLEAHSAGLLLRSRLARLVFEQGVAREILKAEAESSAAGGPDEGARRNRRCVQ